MKKYIISVIAFNAALFVLNIILSLTIPGYNSFFLYGPVLAVIVFIIIKNLMVARKQHV